MENEENNEEPKRLVVEFEIFMHCDACERTVAKAISKVEGVEIFKTDMNENKVTVTGVIDSEKVIKKIKKKTGKRVEVLDIREEKEEEETECDGGNLDLNEITNLPLNIHGRERGENEIEHPLVTMFSDENPNACKVM